MPAADNILRNFQLYIDGKGYAGNCEEFQPPKLTLHTEDFKAGGLDTSLKIELGMEPMEVMFTLTDFDPQALATWGVGPGNAIPIVARGALQNLNGSVTPIVEYIRGTVREMDPGTWQPQAKSSLKFTIDATYYRRNVNGVAVTEIDVINMKRVINGVDTLAKIRTALGIS
jgi:P2 family phage contractile tail tube protein